MKISFFKDSAIESAFYPFAFLRNLEDLLSGVYSNKQRWEQLIVSHFGESVEFVDEKKADLIIDPCVVPSYKIVEILLKGNQNIKYNQRLIVKRKGVDEVENYENKLFVFYSKLELVNLLSDLIIHDKKLFIPKSDVTTVIKDSATKIYNVSDCFVGEDVEFRNATLNAEKGPIIILDGAEIMEHAVIHGPVVIHKNAKVGPHSFLRGGSVVGENSFVLGEMKNVLVMAHSNKGHYGYFGDSIIGEYCNLGAGTSTSNLKNNFSNIKVYDYQTNQRVVTDEHKMGSFVGDFSMTAVNTVLSAGTTIGIMTNVFGSVVYPCHIPSFFWGINDQYREDKYLETGKALLMHKGIESSEINNIIGKLELYYKELTPNK